MIPFLKRPVNRWFLASMLPFYPLALVAFAVKGVFSDAALIYVGAWMLVCGVLLLTNWRRTRDLVLDEQDYGERRAPPWARVGRRARQRNLVIFAVTGIPAGAFAVLWGLSGVAEFLTGPR